MDDHEVRRVIWDKPRISSSMDFPGDGKQRIDALPPLVMWSVSHHIHSI